MSYHRQAKRRDANEFVIVDALRAIGAVVQQLDQRGVPDLLVGYEGRTFLLEVKNPEALGGTRGTKRGYKATKGRGSLTPDQVAWFSAWKGAPIVEVVSVDEALSAIGAQCVSQ